MFALEDGCTGMVTHKIETGDHPPIKQYPRRIPFIQRAKIASMIADMQKQGVVEPSFSSWASPVILVVWAVKYFPAYILGHHCVVYTDHSACTSLLHATHPSVKLARWAMIVQEMDLEIRHRAGKGNTNADALSRNPVEEGVVSAVVKFW